MGSSLPVRRAPGRRSPAAPRVPSATRPCADNRSRGGVRSRRRQTAASPARTVPVAQAHAAASLESHCTEPDRREAGRWSRCASPPHGRRSPRAGGGGSAPWSAAVGSPERAEVARSTRAAARRRSGACPSAIGWACVGVSMNRITPTRRACPQDAGPVGYRAGFAPAGGRAEFREVIASVTPRRPAEPGRKAIPATGRHRSASAGRTATDSCRGASAARFGLGAGSRSKEDRGSGSAREGAPSEWRRALPVPFQQATAMNSGWSGERSCVAHGPRREAGFRRATRPGSRVPAVVSAAKCPSPAERNASRESRPVFGQHAECARASGQAG